MKKIFTCIYCILFFFNLARAADITWTNGGGDNLWSNAANWSTTTVPGSGDVAIFDGTSTASCNVDMDVDISGIAIQSGYVGTINDFFSFNITLAADGFSQADGTFNRGSGDFTITGGNFLLTGGTFNHDTGPLMVGGNFSLTGGTFNCNLSPLASGNVTVTGDFSTNAGLFIATSGTTFLGGNINFGGAGGNFNPNGGTVELNTATTGTIPLSLDPGADTLKFYNLTINRASTDDYSVSEVSKIIVRNDFTINGGSVTGATVGTDTAKVFLEGNFTMGATNTGATNIDIDFVGSNNTTITLNASAPDIYDGRLTFNKTNATNTVTLSSPLTLDAPAGNSLNFINGKLITDAVNVLTITGNDIPVLGASSSSFVDGPVIKIGGATGNSGFIFPVGNGSRYAPIAISGSNNTISDFGTGSAHSFSAQYFHTNPASSFDTASKDPTITNVGACEYWVLDRLADPGANATPYVWLSYDDARSCGITDPSKLLVAHWDGSTWKDLGLGASSPVTIGADSYITTLSIVSTFSPFDLASTDATANVLPITLVNFDVLQQGKDALLLWRTSSEQNSDRFEVESSINGNDFTKIGEVKAAGNSNTSLYYDYIDVNIVRYNSDRIYYRLRQIDIDGKSKYSDIKMLKFGARSPFVKVYPVPFNDKLIVDLPEGWNGTTAISLFDMSGRLIYQGNQTISAVQSNIVISNLPLLAAGTYVLTLKTDKNETRMKVVKQ